MSEEKNMLLKESLKAVSEGSVFNSKLKEDQGIADKPVSARAFMNYLTGRKKFSKLEIERIKTAAKI
ncbi:hypothetical protein [Metabacillus indicus]|uniref:hypothetical protein n=1 Tax=Metabacillus indicus TaxID=246786 RepID=UPI003CF20D53